jgi:hypothetical protein
MGKPTALEERVLINELARAGHTDRKIAEQLGWSVSTIRKWRRRGNREGRQGLASVMGRPPTGELGTFPSVIKETLRVWRAQHPGWGPKTLLAELRADERFRDQRLPSIRSIARFLKAEKVVRSYERHNELPLAPRNVPLAAHEEWEMDAKGQKKITGVGIVSLINLNDRYSHVRLLSYPCLVGKERVERRGKTEDYQTVLRLAFTEWGLPDRLAVDRDSVFYDNTTKSPYPTRLHLWLLALGVTLTFGHPNRPTDQGVTERSHQLWNQQVVEGQDFAGWDNLYHNLLTRRDFLNYRLPCSSLGEVPPLVAHPEALTPRRLYRPEWEAELLDLSRVHVYLAKGRWFRKTGKGGVCAIGCKFYTLGQEWENQQVEITFDASDQHLVFLSSDGKRSKRVPVKGITPGELMGEMTPIFNLPVFQLALPFSWDEWRVIRLVGTLGARLNDT